MNKGYWNMEKIINRIKNNKKFTPRAIDRIILPLGLKKRLVSWNNGSKRVDVDKLIIALRMSSNVKLGKVQKGGDCSKIGSGSYGTVYRLDHTVCIKIINNDKDNQIIENIHKIMHLPGVEEYSTFLKETSYTININNCINNLTNGSSWYHIKYCNQADLLKYIQNIDNKDSIDTLQTNINHCLDSLDFFTSNYYIHGDIKLDNILMDDRYKWLLHDFDFCTCVDNIETFEFRAFTPYYISPFLMNVNKEINSNDYLTNYAKLHTLLTNGSTNSFTNMMNTGKCDSQPDIRDYDFYEQMIDTYYVNVNNHTTNGHNKHKGIYAYLVHMINTHNLNILKMLNLFKSDYYSFGVVIFYIYYKIKKEKISHLEYYADNTLQQLMALCLIPFYTTYKFSDYASFKHGEFIKYCISKFNNEEPKVNKMYDDIYTDMFELKSGGTTTPQTFARVQTLWRKAVANQKQKEIVYQPKIQQPKIQQTKTSQSLILPRLDIEIGSDIQYINDDKIIMKNGEYYKYEENMKKIII